MNPMIDAAALVDGIYEAAVVPEIWPKVLGQIAEATGSLGGVLTAAPPVPRAMLPVMAPKFRWTASDGIHDIITRYFDEGWFARCDWSRRGIKRNYPGFLVDTDPLDAGAGRNRAELQVLPQERHRPLREPVHAASRPTTSSCSRSTAASRTAPRRPRRSPSSTTSSRICHAPR